MTERVITFVAGFGRCGTSLVMQMLSAGGMPVTGRHPAYEDSRVLHLPSETDWLDRCKDSAVKLLDPHIYTPPSGYCYRWVWLDRDENQQALSQAKMLTEMGVFLNRGDRKNLIASYKKDRKKCMKVIGKAPVLFIKFEQLINQPGITAERLAAFCGCEPAPHVVRKRSAKCLDGLLEIELLAGQTHD